jgi:hypothetical protein
MKTRILVRTGLIARWLYWRGWRGVTLPMPWRTCYVLLWALPADGYWAALIAMTEGRPGSFQPRRYAERVRRIIAHEMTHVAQAERLGWWRFYLAYAWGLLRTRSYRNHPMELEAKELEDRA